MRKAVSILVLVAAVSLLMVSSCKSTPKQVTDETFRAMYQLWYSGLILEGAQKYTVKSGDRMVDISRSFYGDPYFYPVIMLASRDVVVDPYKIEPGMELVVPDLQRNLNSVTAKASIKGVINDCARIEDQRGYPDTAAGLREHAGRI
ncbi:MAG: LysM peptidoglycan-binding domain-containing protein [Treponema sp.]|nr:LysM peptidoglycan-binding domain-containing protein [Treponema sp.]